MSKTSVRFLIHKEQRRVLYAEAKSDVINILLRFFTLNLGTIGLLFGNQSGLGSLYSLYDSVEQLAAENLQTKACQKMFLNFRNAAAELFGEEKKKGWNWLKHTAEKEGFFVNDTINFIITHDLRVMPTCSTNALSLQKELGIEDARDLEERVIDFGIEEALNLLRRSLVSRSSLTDVCFPDKCIETRVKCFSMNEETIDVTEVEREINVDIILNKETNSVLFAEVGGDFVNLLLSFLAFPLGSVCDHILWEGCINNLYSSTKSLDLEYFKSEKCKNMLVFPELDSYYGCKSQLLKLYKMISKWTSFTSCLKCSKDNGYKPCPTSPNKDGLTKAKLIEPNLKLKNGVSALGGPFVQDSRRFLVEDNLHISELSCNYVINNLITCKFSDVVKKEVSIDITKVPLMLSAMLISKTVLTDVFSTKLA